MTNSRLMCSTTGSKLTGQPLVGSFDANLAHYSNAIGPCRDLVETKSIQNFLNAPIVDLNDQRTRTDSFSIPVGDHLRGFGQRDW